MSRIGKAPIELPPGVKVEVQRNTICVQGSKGTLALEISPYIATKIHDGTIVVERSSDSHRVRALHGLTRSLINNMVQGVSRGFQKQLEINGVGYRAQMQGRTLHLNLGFSHPITYDSPEGVEIEVGQRNLITVSGIDKQKVGQVAAEIRRFRRPDPYKGKGIKCLNERLRRKEGKGRV
ncbi:MAG: 50S ribosomal protein L6 [Candidatus Binatia bacterium]